ncbi:endo-1,4-beta-xylanase [Pedobacter sp. ASV28]|uniref:endo-1,4-beta-xylanase n=1 Tax=Pedobacter sp. ASV28 TaxID=2795123 RepID=UPI0018EC1528|nr:endo-1,4-beta-xylanase [Pedobacter sp. ASV28]
MKKVTIAAMLLSIMLGACKKQEKVETTTLLQLYPEKIMDVTTATVSTVLQEVNTDIIVGAAINSNRFSNTDYKDLAKLHYNSITAENDMKMNSLNPTKYTWDFGILGNGIEEKNEKIPNLAKDYGEKRIHGHALVWHRALPQWVKDVESNTPVGVRADTLNAIMKRHIDKTVAFYSNYYKGGTPLLPLLRSWDVVNEAYYDDGSLRGNLNLDSEGNDIGSIWKRYMGEIYIEKAFRYARLAARANQNWKLKLFYNDYGHEYSTAKLNAIYNKVMELKPMKEGGDPIINGVGLQMHIRYNTPLTSIKAAIQKMKETGLLVHIAELDISLLGSGETAVPAADLTNRRNLQKSLYYNVAKAYQEIVPIDQRWGITLWNIGDADSAWGLNAEATLFDTSYQKKQNFWNFRDGLNLQLTP